MPLLEREPFLAAFATDLEAAARGAGRTVLVGGEAGIGKTSLVEAFAAAVARGRVLWGACEALSTPHPLAPLHDIARAAGEPLRARLAAGGDPAALFAAVLDELTRAPAPVVLIIEDLHWADAATLDLIRYLGRRIHRAPALLVLTYRDDEVDARHPLRAIFGALPAQHVTRVALPRLSPDAVARLAASMHRDASGVHAATGGNPFFATEVLGHPDSTLPATVRDAVLARMARLDVPARRLLELAAIVPRAIETALIDRVAPQVLAVAFDARPSDVVRDEALDVCIAAGLLVAESDRLHFRHELARVAVEQAIAPPRARALHARVLAALNDATFGTVPLARLVHHAVAAHDVDTVLRVAPRAAREAASRGARREAAAHCRTALAHADRLADAEHAMLLDALAAHAFELNDLETAIAARETAIALFDRLGDRSSQCGALAAHAMPLVRALRNADADVASRAAIAIAETLPDGPARANAYATESYLRMLNRDCDESVAWGEKAIGQAERCGDRIALSAAHNAMGAALFFVDHDRGVAHVETSLRLSREAGDAMRVADAYVMLGTASGEVHRFDDAERYLAEGIAHAAAHDLDRLGGYMAAWQALVDVQRGRWDVAGQRAMAVLAHEPVPSTNRVVALIALGRLRTRRGDPGADAVLDEALEYALRSGTLQRIAPVRSARAEAAWLRNDVDAVATEAAAALDLAIEKRHPWFVGELACWLHRAGRTIATPLVVAPVHAAELDGRWADAAALREDEGCPYERAAALANGDEPAQRAALAIFDGLAANPMAERLRRTMRERGLTAVPRGPRASTRSNAAGLTAREVEVLALAAKGWQNARIAARLSRSTRTVEHHIAAILGKLDVATRHEAIDVARRRGLLDPDA